MSLQEAEPISGAEKGWGVVVGILSFPIGLIATVGLLAGQGWGRWAGLVLGGLTTAAGVTAVIWLLLIFLPSDYAARYPFSPWYPILAGVYTVLAFLATRTFLRGVRAR